MSFPNLDRRRVKMRPLSERANKVVFERDRIDPGASPEQLSEQGQDIVRETAARIRSAREAGRPRMLAFGAHTIKNCLAPVLIRLIEDGWVTHLATNGAGIIHDWELAYMGETSENVRENVAAGCFGTWEETGYFLNLALRVGACEGLGYGESIGAMVEDGGLTIPSAEELEARVTSSLATDAEAAAAAADLLAAVRDFDLPAGRMDIAHAHRDIGLQAAAYRLGIPFTGHPMFGHDILYEHPLNQGAAVGRAAERDFLRYAEGVREIDGGVYMSVGSAVMSPMVFEKAFAMARNIALAEGTGLDDYFMVVVDLSKSHWDWTQGEPPENNPDYYLRYNKTFARMGGTMRYLSADNRDFFLALWQALEEG